ncbi:SPASM domain-containing protein [Blautia hominis]|uniref:SPASM domain-containing protein n=2 Tax=Blautia hominis TaxID=2025493 RepID=A0ABQ0BDG2_9FIRM
MNNMPAISVLMKPSSSMCNMHCDYCFYCDEAQKRQQGNYGYMSEQTLKNVIRKTILRAEGGISYAFQGGEPTLRGISFFEKAVQYERQYNKGKIRIDNAIQTNGLLIDENWCRFFRDNKFLVGISLDGIRKTHDAYRHDKKGNPTFDRILYSIKLLERFGVDYNILTVVNQKVAENIEEIYQFYKRKNFKYQQYIACLEPLDEVRGKNEYAISPEQYGEFLSTLFQMWYEDWKNGIQPYIRQFENYIGIVRGYRPEACEQYGKCGIHNVVEADGSVYPCDFYMLDSYCIGNFNVDQLDAIDAERLRAGFVQKSDRLDKRCLSCEYYHMCRGGCHRNREYSKDSDTYRNYFCESYRYLFKTCMRQIKEIAGVMDKIKYS